MIDEDDDDRMRTVIGQDGTGMRMMIGTGRDDRGWDEGDGPDDDEMTG